VNEALLAQLCQEIGLNLSGEQLRQFGQYYQQLLEWNKKFNLTAIEEEQEVIVKHFYDSLLGCRSSAWTGTGRLLDLGSGAGFPGLPLKLAFPHLEVVLVDSLQKRVGFLKHIITELGLRGIEAIHGRAEDLGQSGEQRENYDFVVSRAVAKMPVLSELCLPFVKVGGIFMAYKGPEGVEEFALAGKALEILGGKEKELLKFNLPLVGGQRIIISIEKVKLTPKAYPRKAGLPNKKPLQ